MKCLLGIDVGTSGVKALLLNANGKIVASAYREYGVDIPALGRAEQDPETWWKATQDILLELKTKQGDSYKSIACIGFSGQMHGLVMVDKDMKPIRPAIVWLDQRAKREVEHIYGVIPSESFHKITLNRASSGFALPSLLWIKQHEPGKFEKIFKVMLPKDYVRMRMTGQIATDMSDASSTVAFDTKKREWAGEILWALGLRRELFPECYEGDMIAGTVRENICEDLGLPKGVPVVFGGGDQPVQGVGNGVIRSGLMYTNIGTSGQVSIYSDKPMFDSQHRTHTFCHAIKNGWSIFGATLSSGLALKWLKNNILELEDYNSMCNAAAEVPAGSDGVMFLPYLAGERTPHFDNSAKAIFFGLRLGHDQRHMIRSVMEGVVYSLKESLVLFEEMGVEVSSIIAAGGGSRNPVWVQMQADVFGKPVRVINVSEQACLGAAMLAGVGCGLFESYEQATDTYVRFSDRVYEPDPRTQEAYLQGFDRYKKLYNNNKILYKE